MQMLQILDIEIGIGLFFYFFQKLIFLNFILGVM